MMKISIFFKSTLNIQDKKQSLFINLFTEQLIFALQ